jgi:outer membrane receptor protein involved in Fe transport
MKRGVLLASATAAALLSSFFSANAQTGSQSDIETVIVTGNRPPLNEIPMKATFSQSTITPEAILNITPSPATTVQTLLNTQPSIYATVGATNGMETDIKFRSFVDGEFGETIAGVPLNDIFNGGVTFQADNRNNQLLITRDLDSVEIFRGVNNPAVNTYNSLGGTINYIPRQPTEEMGADVGVDGGSFNTLEAHATVNTGNWGGIRQTLSVERDTSKGWLQNTGDWSDNVYYAANADLPEHTQVFSYFVFNKNEGDAPQFVPFNIISQQFNFQWPTNLYRSVNNDTNYLGIVGVKSDVTSWLHVENEAYAGDNNYQRVSYHNPAYPGPYFIDDGATFPFWTFYASPPLYNPGFPGNYALGEQYHFYGYNAALYGDRVQAKADLPYNMVTFGGDYNVGVLHSREYWWSTFDMPKIVGFNDAWDEHDSRTVWSAYVQDDIHLFDDRLHITPGIKYIQSTVKDNDALGFFYVPPGSIKGHEHFLSPTLGANFTVTDDFTVYGAYGRNVKFPDITALYNVLGFGGFVPPVTAQPEYAQDFELGARYQMGTLRAELNAYSEKFSHVLYSAPVPNGGGATEQLNGGSQRFRGVEMQITDDFGEFWIGHWQGFLNGSYNEAQCATLFVPFNTGAADTGNGCSPGQQLSNVPRYLATAGLIWDYDGWHVDVQGRFVGSQSVNDFNTGLPATPSDLAAGQPTKISSYFLANLGIIKVIPLENIGPAKALRLGLHIDNLFDKRYFSEGETGTDANNPNNTLGNQEDDFYGITGEPRAVFASVGVYF